MQDELLATYPKANLRVYAIWFNMVRDDDRSRWPSHLMTDARAIHRWDEAGAVGTWYGLRKSAMLPKLTPDSNGTGSEILWDSYLLYRPDARWTTAPDGLTHWGRTILAGRETLRKEFERLFLRRR